MWVSELLDAVAANQTPLLAVESPSRPALERIGKLWSIKRPVPGLHERADLRRNGPCPAGAGGHHPAGSALERPAGAGRVDDYHLLGKQIVRAVLRAAGWPALDYGRQSVAELVARTCADEIDILMIALPP